MENSIFVVNKEPYCIWEVDIIERNREFLNGIDSEYFEYVAGIHTGADDEKRAAIALRSTLHHAMETMFSLLGAYIQAPDCAYAWIAKCSNYQLRDFVSEINEYNSPLYTKLNIDSVTWKNVSKSVFCGYLPNSEKNERTVNCFAKLWMRLAIEFINPAHIDEYNSIKHGFRVKSGGFTLAVGKEHEYGVSPPQEDMKVIGQSKYGTTILKLEPITNKKGDRSYRSRRYSLNWRIEKTVLLLQLTSMSITNITSALKIANGVEAGTCKFARPVDDDDFIEPWKYSPGVTSSSIDYEFEVNESMETKKEELENIINEFLQEKVNKSKCAD